MVLAGSTAGNTLHDNDIYYNTEEGILLYGMVTHNKVEGDRIHSNGGPGISEAGTAGINWWSQVSIYWNGGLGIDRLANGTPDEPYPVITGFSSGPGGSLLVSGISQPGNTVELYTAAPARDPSGFGEGRYFIASALADAAGHWQIPVSGCGLFTAFEMEPVSSYWDGSEFGPTTACHYLPLLFK